MKLGQSTARLFMKFMGLVESVVKELVTKMRKELKKQLVNDLKTVSSQYL